MGFGLLLLGYFTVLGVLPTSFVYNSYMIAVPIIGAVMMFVAFHRLQAYNIYFKSMKYICGSYILLLAGLAPFLIIYHSDMPDSFLYVSKALRIFLLFVFHYFLLYAVNSLAKQIDNPKIIRASRRNIYATYSYFIICVLALFPVRGIYAIYFQVFSMVFGIIYYFLIIVNIFSCYVKITTE